MTEKDYDALHKISKRRKSHRTFSDEKINPELLDKIKDIALSSPYASGKKNWDFVVLEDKDLIVKVAEIVEKKSESMNQYIRDDFVDSYRNYAKNFVLFKNAPAVIFLNYRTPSSFSMMFDKAVPEDIEKSIREWERDNYVKSISCVAMQILLATESLGLGACYMTGALLAEKEIQKIIPIKPGRKIGAIIPIGFKNKEN